MDRDSFVARYAGVFESSPEFAVAAWKSGAGEESEPEGVARHFERVLRGAGEDAVLALLRSHPELGVRAAEAEGLTPESRAEQSGAGLDACSPSEYRAFRELNARYRERFGFPFIVAVRGLDRETILRQFRQRIDNDPETERTTAMAEVIKIARARVEDLFDG